MLRQFTPPLRRGAFTLVELLVVVLIVMILATIVLSAMFHATEAGKAARTRAQISKLNSLIGPMWESYRTRRVDVAIPANTGAAAAAALRLDVLRELMRMELPDRKTDVVDGPGGSRARPALSAAYLRRAVGGWTEANQGAECLYMIVSRIQDGDTNGLEFFRETEIGDTDNDGMPEILDGWGKPIAFLRWAPGFVDGRPTTADAPKITSAYQNGTDPDAFDPYGVRGTPGGTPSTSYYLFPLIFSAGPDGVYGIAAKPMSGNYQYSAENNNPYTTTPSPPFGTPDETSGNYEYNDNIHNHLLSTGVN